MEITIKGDSKEIAALVVELQERRNDKSLKILIDGKNIVDTVLEYKASS
jgi:hypothetical protein